MSVELAHPQSADAPQVRQRFLRLREVIHRSGLPRTSLYRDVASGAFPKPIAIGKRSRGWIESEVDAWIEAHIRARSS